MELNILLSGAIGAVVATAVAVFYQHISLIEKRRFDVAVMAVDYLDELYHLLVSMHVMKDRLYEDGVGSFNKAEYNKHADMLNKLITSVRVRSRIELVYGKPSRELSKFTELIKLLRTVKRELASSKESTWSYTHAATMDAFNNKIDPLGNEVHEILTRAATVKSIFSNILSKIFRVLLIVTGVGLLLMFSVSLLANTVIIEGRIVKLVDSDTFHLLQKN